MYSPDILRQTSCPEAPKASEKMPLTQMLEKTAAIIIEQSLQLKPTDKLLLIMSKTAWPLADAVLQEAEKVGAQVHISMFDAEMAKYLLEALPDPNNYNLPLEARNKVISDDCQEQGIAAIHYGPGNDQLKQVIWATKYLIIRDTTSTGNSFKIEEIFQREYDAVAAKILRFRNDDPDKTWALIYWANAKEAALAGLSLEEYQTVYYGAIIEKDWNKVYEANQVLIDFLYGKDHFRVYSPAPVGFPADWVTDVAMSITGMRMLNSTIINNLPGSEIFAAPVAGTVEGTFAIPYPVLFKSRILPNIKLVFKLVKWNHMTCTMLIQKIRNTQQTWLLLQRY